MRIADDPGHRSLLRSSGAQSDRSFARSADELRHTDYWPGQQLVTGHRVRSGNDPSYGPPLASRYSGRAAKM